MSTPELPTTMQAPVPSLSTLPVEIVHEADQHALDYGRDTAGIAVALMVTSEVFRIGLEVLLRRLPKVGAVLALDPETLHTRFAPGNLDILIVAAEEWHVLGDCHDLHEHLLPPVLVLGEPTLGRRAGFSALPSDGFLSLTDLSARTLADAIERTIAGEVPMPPTLARELLSMHRVQLPQTGARPVALTSRERETLELMASGMSNKQIAKALTISTHGAKRLVGSVLSKFDAPNRTAAVMSAIHAGLI